MLGKSKTELVSIISSLCSLAWTHSGSESNLVKGKLEYSRAEDQHFGELFYREVERPVEKRFLSEF